MDEGGRGGGGGGGNDGRWKQMSKKDEDNEQMLKIWGILGGIMAQAGRHDRGGFKERKQGEQRDRKWQGE